MQEILMETYTILLPVLLGYIVWLLKEQRKTAEKRRREEDEKRDAISKGAMLLLRVQLIEYHDEWMERGYVTKHGIENFIEMYNTYHSLGGNGMMTHLLEEVSELPIRN